MRYLLFRAVLTCALVLAACAAPAGALPRRPVAPGAILPGRIDPLPAGVTAGNEIDIRWHGIPRDTDELELILSLDDGKCYTLRVSPQLDGASVSYRWRVPNVAAERARIRLRYGTEAGERDGALSAAFAIVMDAKRPIERDVVREDRGWSMVEPVSTLRPDAFAPEPETSLVSGRDLAACESPPTDDLRPVAAGAFYFATARARPFRPATVVEGARAPLFVPLRN